jgi:hypothetical protein
MKCSVGIEHRDGSRLSRRSLREVVDDYQRNGHEVGPFRASKWHVPGYGGYARCRSRSAYTSNGRVIHLIRDETCMFD